MTDDAPPPYRRSSAFIGGLINSLPHAQEFADAGADGGGFAVLEHLVAGAVEPGDLFLGGGGAGEDDLGGARGNDGVGAGLDDEQGGDDAIQAGEDAPAGGAERDVGGRVEPRVVGGSRGVLRG